MTPAGRKTRALIGYLCIMAKPVGRERLASLLWGDRGDEQARASLRQSIYEVRSMLAGDRLLKLERDTVSIGDDVSTDMAAITAAAQSGDLQRLAHALSEWRGDFFEDLPSIDESFDAWLRGERHRVQENLITAAIEAANAGVARGEVEPARRIVSMLQQRDGMNEIVLRLGLRLDHVAGDSAALRRRYERFRDLLKAELDAAPAAETQRLYQDLTARTSASNQIIASGPDSDISRNARKSTEQEDETGSARSSPPPVMQSFAKTYGEAPVSKPARFGHWTRIAGAVFVVASLFALAWVILSSLHKAVSPSVHPPTDHANVSPTLAMERRLLAIDTYSDQNKGKLAAIEKAARAAAQDTLVRDPNNGEALGVFAVLTPSTHLQEIDRLFQRALRSDPNNAQLLNWHARFLMTVGRNHEALAELTRAYERDRGARSIAANLVVALLLTGRLEEARQIMDLSLNNELDNRSLQLHVKYFLYDGNWFGLTNLLRALPGDLSPPRAAFYRLCYATAMAFATRDSKRFPQLRAGWRTEFLVDPAETVEFLSALGEGEGTLQVVQSVVRSRRNDDLLTGPGWDVLFSPGLIALRRDPRVAALLAQWGLSEYWRVTGSWPDFMR